MGTRRSETESSLYCESAKEVLSEKKVTETITSEIAKIINEKEIVLIKISEHILITLCQLRNIAGSREKGRCHVISRCYLKSI